MIDPGSAPRRGYRPAHARRVGAAVAQPAADLAISSVSGRLGVVVAATPGEETVVEPSPTQFFDESDQAGVPSDDATLRIDHGIQVAGDPCQAVRAIIAAALVAIEFTPGAPLSSLAIVVGTTLLVHVVAIEVSGLYRNWRGSKLARELWCVVITWIYVAPTVLGIAWADAFGWDASDAVKKVGALLGRCPPRRWGATGRSAAWRSSPALLAGATPLPPSRP